MVDQNILDYIRQQMQSGYDADSIKKALLSQGWKEKEVSDAINAVKKQNISSKQTVNQVQTNKKQLVDMTNSKYAGFWIRFLATIIDGIIISIFTYPVTIYLTLSGMLTLSLIYSYLMCIVFSAIIIIMEGTVGGTPGKLAVGIRVVNEKGEKIGILNAFIRYIGKAISTLILCIGYLMIAFDSKKQGLHDKIAKTYVVYKK